MSPLHHAALSGNKELISLLLEAQAAVDIKDLKGKNTNMLTVALKPTVAMEQAQKHTWLTKKQNNNAQTGKTNKYFFMFPV